MIPNNICNSTLPSEIAVEPYINKREVAKRLGYTTRTVEKMMRRGQIPFYKPGGYRVAFRWSEIQSHLAQTCRVTHGTTPSPN